ncbi:MAG: IS5 family transposase [Chloroflexota bacterium]|nr:IS5 family transposase [Chloroflexota bacterium]
MRREPPDQGAVWSYVRLEERVPQDHPLRRIRAMTDRALRDLDPLFDRLYAKTGRPSIPPEWLLRALLLQALYSVRSERLLMEELQYNLLFRWFVGLEVDDRVWDVTVFTKNRERLLRGDVAQAFFSAVIAQAREQDLLSDEHFSVDGTLIEAWAGHKSFRPKDAAGGTPGGSGDFKGRPRRNDTHQSTTDPEARLFRKGDGHEARLAFLGHVLMDHRCGLAVGGTLTAADGFAERAAALALVRSVTRRPRATLAADKAYDAAELVGALREEGVTPHVAQNTTRRRSAIDGRTTRHPGYAMSQQARRAIERINGWIKTVALMRKTRHRGRRRVGWAFTFALAAYDLVRMRNLAVAA